jgi:insertion element IS1 protein InsB
VTTRRVLTVLVGERSDFTAECLWLSLPEEYRVWAVFYTDFLPAYHAVIPNDRHVSGGKGDGLTNHIERF